MPTFFCENLGHFTYVHTGGEWKFIYSFLDISEIVRTCNHSCIPQIGAIFDLTSEKCISIIGNADLGVVSIAKTNRLMLFREIINKYISKDSCRFNFFYIVMLSVGKSLAILLII
jgi:hypothetical protein